MLCSRCGQDQPDDQFGPSAKMWPERRECRSCSSSRSQRRRHGLTKQERQQIADYQGGCRICGHSDPGKRGWIVDHDHTCCPGEESCPKCRRGIVCTYCNSMLGYAFDRIQTLTSAIDYLTERQKEAGCNGWHLPIVCGPSICTAYAK
jgi:hypothetical protein